MFKLRRVPMFALSGLVAATAMTGLSVVGATSAQAAGPVFGAMNTSETPPDGVWFRNSPHTGDTDRAAGHGVYAGDSVQLQCYAWGDAVGAYNNTLWYYVNNVTRPTVSSNGQPNVGYLNAHYINDGQNANVADAGVGQCGAAPPPTPSGGSVYYSPYGAGSHLPTGAINTLTLSYGQWTGTSGDTSCNPSNAFSSTPYMVNGRLTSMLFGWSKGRVGPLYELEYLRAVGSSMRNQIKYIFVIDPGSDELIGSCDGLVGGEFASWLGDVTDAQLVILAGPDTRVNSAYGIEHYYFDPIRNSDRDGKNRRARVLVCNYSDPGESTAQSHQTIYASASHLIGQQLSSCPSLNKMTYLGSRHP